MTDLEKLVETIAEDLFKKGVRNVYDYEAEQKAKK